MLPAIGITVLIAAGSGGAAEEARRAPYRLVQLPIRLSAPVHVAAPAGSSRLYVVQRSGRIRILARGRLLRPAFLDISRQVSLGGEQGMFSVAFHPAFATNGLLYVCYTDRTGAVVVAEYRSAGDRVAHGSGRILARVPHDDSPFHNGGQLAFGPDGRLYVGSGDGGYTQPGTRPDPSGNAQNLDVLLGKIFALDVSAPNPQPEIVAYGLRNPWRFSLDPGRNAFVVADVGWNSNEELNYLRLGTGLVNFGWSVYEGRRPRPQAGPLNPAGQLTWPFHRYETGRRGNCSIVGGFVYRGSVRQLRGRYLFGDYCSGRIWSLRITDGRATGHRREPLTVGGLTSFGEDGRGELYAVSVDRGRVYRVVRR
jgi:glucose/arabinose dehydrogenase